MEDRESMNLPSFLRAALLSKKMVFYLGISQKRKSRRPTLWDFGDFIFTQVL
jgi:hypothetical protein